MGGWARIRTNSGDLTLIRAVLHGGILCETIGLAQEIKQNLGDPQRISTPKRRIVSSHRALVLSLLNILEQHML